ncbi:hypothetical protein ACCO45_012204, partial [Purpureocillium lilacinum]
QAPCEQAYSLRHNASQIAHQSCRCEQQRKPNALTPCSPRLRPRCLWLALWVRRAVYAIPATRPHRAHTVLRGGNHGARRGAASPVRPVCRRAKCIRQARSPSGQTGTMAATHHLHRPLADLGDLAIGGGKCLVGHAVVLRQAHAAAGLKGDGPAARWMELVVEYCHKPPALLLATVFPTILYALFQEP